MAHVLPMMAALCRAGCDAHLLCLGGGGLAEAAAAQGLPVETVAMASPWDLRVLGPLRDRLDRFPWDVIHSHGMRANLPVRLLSPLLRRRPCLFTTVHSDLASDYASGAKVEVYRRLDRATAGRVDQLVYVSDDLRRKADARAMGRDRSIVVPSGLAIAPQAARGGLADAVWRGDPPAADRPRLGTVARLVPVKDLELFVDVVRRVRDEVPDLRAAVVGDGPEATALQRYADEAGISATLTWSGEVRPGSEAVAEFDVFLLTSRAEGVPVSVLEAMAAGLPVVATAVGGLPEVVVDGVTGFLVPRTGSRDGLARALAERVTRLLCDPELRSAMGEAGVRRVERVFSIDVVARTLLTAYERCVAGRHRVRALAGA
jgi:glycosyltransferase involved in cell wall biosynthesis